MKKDTYETLKAKFDKTIDDMKDGFIKELTEGKTVEAVIELASDIYTAIAIAEGIKENVVFPEQMDVDMIAIYYKAMVKEEISEGIPAYDEDYLFELYSNYLMDYEEEVFMNHL